ncbi:38093_t:CDS:1, partial [Gigaspora margarita]
KGTYDSYKKKLDPKRQKEAILKAGKGDSNIAGPRAISRTFDQSPEER